MTRLCMFITTKIAAILAKAKKDCQIYCALSGGFAQTQQNIITS